MMKLKKLMQRAVRRLGYDLRWIPDAIARHPARQLSVSLEMAIARRFLEVDDFFFVQVGAYDGQCVDPIANLRNRLRWRGLMAEPNPAAFAALQRHMRAEPEVELVRVAVSDQEGELPFYTLDPSAPHATERTALISSLDRETFLRELGTAMDWSPWIRPLVVPCVTLNTLLAERGVSRVDLLQIDAEGHDARILRSLDFRRWQPWIINFEHALLSKFEAEACWEMLIRHGYSLHVSQPDTLAVWQPPA